MSRKLLAALSLILWVLALGFAALQLMLLSPGPDQATGSPDRKPERSVLRSGEAVGMIQNEWRRVSWELGRRPPEIEEREDY